MVVISSACTELPTVQFFLFPSNATIVDSVPVTWGSVAPPARQQPLDQVCQHELVHVSVAGLIPRLVNWEGDEVKDYIL